MAKIRTKSKRVVYKATINSQGDQKMAEAFDLLFEETQKILVEQKRSRKNTNPEYARQLSNQRVGIAEMR